MPTKAVSAASSVGVGGAVATLVIALWWPGADATVAVALTTLFNTIGAFLGAYLARYESAA